MPNFLVMLNFISNLVFVTVDFEVVEDIDNSFGVDCGVDESEIESPDIIFIKGSPL